jgi:two-component system cell cycle sensor histidine kinase/response regulator CckA
VTGTSFNRLAELRAWLGASQAGVWRWKAQEELVSVDQHSRRHFGIPSNQLIRTLNEFLAFAHPADSGYLRERLQQTSSDTNFHCTTIRIQDPATASIRWIANYIGGLPEGEHEHQAVILSIDITAQRLSEERSLEARRLESLGRLAGGVAHESNNQLMVILQCAHFVLGRRDLPQAAREDLELIRRAAERTANITAQLLAFGRRQVLRPQAIDLKRSLQENLPVLERSLGERARLHLHLDSRVKAIHVDPDQFLQILLNLVLNARDALERPGHVLITSQRVKFEPGASVPGAWETILPGEYVMVVVADNGRGMNEVTRARAFEPFYTTKEVGRGTGLGLAMVYGIVRQSQGYIWVESEPGQGTTFRMLFPLGEMTHSGQSVEAGGEEMIRPLKQTSVMVVDDDPDVRTVIVRTLEAGGYIVMEAESGSSALSHLTLLPRPVDLLLTDLVMPGMSGQELGRQVARGGLATHILYMSGMPDLERRPAGNSRDTPKTLVKPIAPAELLEEVRVACADREPSPA